MRAQLAHVDAVVMGSHFIADSYRRWRVLPSNTPVHVVPYGVPMHESRLLLRGLTSSRPLRFGYIGALLPHKGVHVCIQAFREMSGGQAELHVWGSSEDRAYVSALESSAADAGHIHFHGAFPETEKTAILRSLDVLLMPSIGLESFGLVAREAMEQGHRVTSYQACMRGNVQEESRLPWIPSFRHKVSLETTPCAET